jgi:hypothetical protein
MIDANGGWQDKKGSAATRGQGLRKQSGCELSASCLDFLSGRIVESLQSSNAPPLFLPPQVCHFVKFCEPSISHRNCYVYPVPAK